MQVGESELRSKMANFSPYPGVVCEATVLFLCALSNHSQVLSLGDATRLERHLLDGRQRYNQGSTRHMDAIEWMSHM